jgi:hypothetical protein
VVKAFVTHDLPTLRLLFHHKALHPVITHHHLLTACGPLTLLLAYTSSCSSAVMLICGQSSAAGLVKAFLTHDLPTDGASL